MTLSHKDTKIEVLEPICQLVIYGISDNMAVLVRYSKYGTLNTTDTPTMVYYVIKFVSDSNTLQEDNTCDVKIFSAGGLFFKAPNSSCMQENTNWYWDQKKQQQVIIVPTQTIVHPFLDVVEVKDADDIPKNSCNRNNAKTSLSRGWCCRG